MSYFKNDLPKPNASLRMPLLDKTEYQSPDSFRFRKAFKKSATINCKFNQFSKTPRAFQIPHLQLNNKEPPSHPSNKFIDILVIFFLAILSTIQFSIFIYISNSINLPLSSSQMIQDFCVLAWKWQIFLTVLLIYGIISHLINKNKRIDETQTLISKTQSSNEYYYHSTHFFQSSNLNNVFSSLNIESLSSSLLSVVASFCLFYSCRYLTFTICALISNLTSLIPYYFYSNAKNKTLNLISLVAPLLIIIGIAILLIHLNSLTISIYFFVCFIAVFGCQLINHMALLVKIKEEQHFQLLLSTYINYVLISTLIIIGIQLATWSFDIHLLFYWLIDWKLFLKVLIGFGFCGLGYVFLSMFASIAVQNKNYTKMIKYIEIPMNDLVGVAILSLYQSPISGLYCVSIFQILSGIGLLEFYLGLMQYLNKKNK